MSDISRCCSTCQLKFGFPYYHQRTRLGEDDFCPPKWSNNSQPRVPTTFSLPSFSLDIFSTTVTLLGTNSSPPKMDGWETDPFLSGFGLFSGGKLLVFREGPSILGIKLDCKSMANLKDFPSNLVHCLVFFGGVYFPKDYLDVFFSNICSFHTYLGKGSNSDSYFSNGLKLKPPN